MQTKVMPKKVKPKPGKIREGSKKKPRTDSNILTPVYFFNSLVKYSSFVWTTATDELVPASSSMKYVQAMLEHGRNVKFHLFAKGSHGLSLATDLTAGSSEFINKEVSAWFDMAHAWLAKTFG